MLDLVLRESRKIIVDCSFFKKENSSIFRVEFVDWQKTGKTYKDKSGTDRDQLEKVIKFIFVDREKLPADLSKKSDTEICQELKGKSLVITTSITDK